MSIWTRHGLSFVSQPELGAKEHLDVLVLNGASYFIDFRVKLGSGVSLLPASSTSATPTTLTTEERLKLKGDLDWAFAGTRLEGKPGEGEGGSTYCKWSTTICSRSPPPQAILLDEGNLHFSLTDPTIFYERGIMTHPITGLGSPGEEIWHSHPKKLEDKMVFMEREDGGGILGMIGLDKLGVGRKGESGQGNIYAWRSRGNDMIYQLGELEGVEVLERVSREKDGEEGKEWEVGEFVEDNEGRKWIIRELVRRNND